jgi:quercetin dioxygenase-like cupin family protein
MFAVLSLLPVLCGAVSDCRRDAPQGGGPLPPPKGDLPPQDRIQTPFTEAAPGVFTRTVYRTAASPTLTVEVRDLEIAPGKRAEDVALPGAAVLEVRSGTATARVGGERRDVTAGAVLSLSQGTPLAFENHGDVTLSIRLFVVGAGE